MNGIRLKADELSPTNAIGKVSLVTGDSMTQDHFYPKKLAIYNRFEHLAQTKLLEIDEDTDIVDLAICHWKTRRGLT